ncbi:MAG: hypothetical protein ACK4LB_04835 [Spirosomataceae bacterium]
MNKQFLLLLLLFSTLSASGQNFTVEQTIEYINKKMKIADPVFHSFTLGPNGETNFIWVTRNLRTEFRFNLREVEFDHGVSSEGDHYLSLQCRPGTFNCLQQTFRQMTSQEGDDATFKNHKTLFINSLSGMDNNVSVKNALVYLKIISLRDNADKSSTKRDPFLN